jgi:glycosyltransferase involved in cell wall biosynthesis
MKLSIVTPTYNSALTIQKCVESVFKQNYADFEHIIVDNFSADNTLTIVRDLYKEHNAEDHLVVICAKDDGIADAFNKGIRAAKGEVVAILNSDDEFYDEELFSKNAEVFKSQQYLFTHGDIIFKDDVYGTNVRQPLMCSILAGGPYHHPGMFVRKLLYLSQGLYDVDFMYSMDYEIWLRWEVQIPNFRSHGFYMHEKPVVVMHAGGASWNYELRTIQEVKAAQIKHRVWNWRTMYNYYYRYFKIRTKAILTQYHLERIVHIWRNFKWKG